jgi:hypothetical protein
MLAADGSYRSRNLILADDGSQDAPRSEGFSVATVAPIITRDASPGIGAPRARGAGGRISVASVPGLGTGPVSVDGSPAPRTPKPLLAAPAQPAAAPETARPVGASALRESALLAAPSTGYSIGRTFGIVLLLLVVIFLVVRRLEL